MKCGNDENFEDDIYKDYVDKKGYIAKSNKDTEDIVNWNTEIQEVEEAGEHASKEDDVGYGTESWC